LAGCCESGDEPLGSGATELVSFSNCNKVNKVIGDKSDFIDLCFGKYFAAELVSVKLKSTFSVKALEEEGVGNWGSQFHTSEVEC
jgi:hypothetical protein